MNQQNIAPDRREPKGSGGLFHAVSLSGGKDSTALLLLMIERGLPIDAVIWADTGMEFPEMYGHIAKVDEYDRYLCVDCGQIEKRDYEAPLGHAYQSSIIREATCEMPGKTLDICQRCGDTKETIIRYARTREVYAAYKKSRHKKEFRAAHAEEIAQHEAAKKAFDALGSKPIPKVAQLSKVYAALLAEKQAEYETYKALRQEMVAVRTAKQNVDRILGLEPQDPEQKKERQTR